MNFKIGDEVQLVSGGPHMTVSNNTDNLKIRCDWFSDNGKACHEFYPSQILKKVVQHKEIELKDSDL